jgi:hypothetical protein
MSRKRPSICDSLELTGEPAIASPSNVIPLSQEPTARPKPNPEVQHTSIYVPKVAYRKIREIAVIRDAKPHDIIMEGIDLVLGKYGHPSVADLKKGKP